MTVKNVSKGSKTILSFGVAVSLLATSAWAVNGDQNGGDCDHKKGKHWHSKMADMSPEARAKHREKHHAEREAKLFEALKLTDAQKAQMSAFSQSQEAQKIQLFTQAKALRSKMRELKNTNASDEQKQAIKTQLKDVRDSLHELREAHKDKLKSILTAEQKQSLEVLHKARKDKRGDGRRRGGFGKHS